MLEEDRQTNTKSELAQVKESKKDSETELNKTKRVLHEERQNMNRLKSDYNDKLKLAQTLCKKYQDDMWNREQYYENFVKKLNLKFLNFQEKMEENLEQKAKDFELKEKELQNKIMKYDRDSEFLSCKSNRQSSVRRREAKQPTRLKGSQKLMHITKKCCRK